MNADFDIHHLLGRLGIGIRCKNLTSAATQSKAKLIDFMLNKPNVAPPPPNLTQLDEVVKLLNKSKSKQARKSITKKRNKENKQLVLWWLKTIHQSNHPLHERLTIFWHSHFPSSTKRVKWPQLMYKQHLLLRNNAQQSFASMLKAICFDPAMLIYLDGRNNTKTEPNENFARELLELFTLGIGHYTEADIISVARAFTGWKYNIKRGKVYFLRKQYDAGIKSF